MKRLSAPHNEAFIRRLVRPPPAVVFFMVKVKAQPAQVVRSSRATRLATRRMRAESRGLRAMLRAEQLISRRIVDRSRLLRARVMADKTITRARQRTG